MKKILFVCHGNICRSPMAEAIMKHKVSQLGLEKEFFIDSCAVSTEEIGNQIYPSIYRELVNHGIKASHRARQITLNDLNNFDYIYVMDESNLYYMRRLFNKSNFDNVCLITKYLPGVSEIADPYYYGNVDIVYKQLDEAIDNIIKELE